MTRRTLVIALILSCTVQAQGQKSEQNNALHERGLHADKLYHFGDFDNVSLFNGNLGLRLPIGPSYAVSGGLTYQLQLHYNSKFWDFDRSSATGADLWSHAFPASNSNAGLGWILGLGRYLEPGTGGALHASYEAPDGGEHPFLKKDFGGSPAYTKDGSNLRLRILPDDIVEIDFPDGTVQQHRKTGPQEWILTEIRAPRGTGKVTLDVVTPPTPVPQCGTANDFVHAWKISDTEGRNHYVCFQNHEMDDVPRPLAEKVVFEAPPDQTALIWDPFYEELTGITNVSGEFDPGSPSRPPWRTSHEVQLLKSLKLPDGSSWQFGHEGIDPNVSSVILPTQAKILYEYEGIPVNDVSGATGRCAGPFPETLPGARATLGVSKRTVIPAVRPGVAPEEHVWIYNRRLEGVNELKPQQCDQPFFMKDLLVVEVEDPHDGLVKSYFSVWEAAAGATDAGASSLNKISSDHYGLPWGVYDPEKRRYLSQEQKDCSTTGGCKTLRTTWVRHDFENLFVDPTLRRYPVNRLAFQEVVHHDCTPESAPCTTTTENSDWDEFSHYRKIETSWNFGTGNTGRRIAYTNWNRGRTIAGNQPWFLDVYDWRTTEDENGEKAGEQACFALGTFSQPGDPSGVAVNGRGFLRATRVFADKRTKNELPSAEPAPGPTDLFTVFELNPADLNPRGEKYYGGDDVRLPAGVAEAATACAALDALGDRTPVYAGTRTWDKGSVATSKHTGASFLTMDLDVHASGLVTASRDTAGAPTVYSYDEAGRIESIKPPNAALTSYSYGNASAAKDSGGVWRLTQPATAMQRTESPDGAVETRYEFDSYGRVTLDQKLFPANKYLRQEHTYDAFGRRKTSSVLGSDSTLAKTRFTYDTDGRVTEVIAPDGGRVTYKYEGPRFKTRTAWIWNGTANVESRTKEEYDGLGRLVSVTEPSGAPAEQNAAGSDVQTVYTYDVRDRLTSVKTTGHSQPERTFQYDGRGFLRKENHPESGEASYDYDARGHMVSKSVPAYPAFDLKYDYDESERPIAICGRGVETTTPDRCADGFRPLKAVEYATANEVTPNYTDWRNGLLWRATRFNYPVDNPPPTLKVRGDTISVTETYKYLRGNGRRTERTTEVKSGTDVLANFTQATDFNELDFAHVITYPKCDGCGLPLRDRVTTTYKNGLVDGVRSNYTIARIEYEDRVIDSTLYASNGTWKERKHANGITDVQGPDPDGLPRPQSLGVSVASSCDLIDQEPLSAVVAVGSPVTFTVTSSSAAPAFQWYEGASGDTRRPVTGGTSNSLFIAAVQATTSYWCRVSTAGCSEDSGTVTADTCRLISAEPSDVAVIDQSPATLTVSVDAAGATFQWYKGLRGDESARVEGATSNVLQIASVKETATYWCRVELGVCAQKSRTATVKKCAPLAILQPAADAVSSTEVPLGGPLTFKALASGELLSYQWYSGVATANEPIGTGAAINYTPSAVTLGDEPLLIEVVVSNGCTSVRRVVARLVVKDARQAEYPPCVADVTLPPSALYQTIRPNQPTRMEAEIRLAVPPARPEGATPYNQYASLQYRFVWYHEGIQVFEETKAGVTPAKSEYLLRFATPQTYTRLEATVTCTPPGGTAIDSPVRTFKSLAFQYGHCPVPHVAALPANIVLTRDEETNLLLPTILLADSIHPLATFQWFAGESGNTREPIGTGAALSVVDAATYWVRASTDCAHADSATVTVAAPSAGGDICTPVRILKDPQNKEIEAFAPISLTVDAASVPEPNYFIWAAAPEDNIPGARLKTLTLNPGPRKTTDYAVRVGNGCSSIVRSRYARVHVTRCADITIYEQPRDISIAGGEIATLSITASSIAPLRYQWYRGESGDTSNPIVAGDEGLIAQSDRGATEDTIDGGETNGSSLDLGTPAVTGRYWVRMSFEDPSMCEVDSRTATVSVCNTPRIPDAPHDRSSAGPGLDQIFSVVAEGEQLSYAWYEGSNTNDETQTPLSVTPALLVYPQLTTDYWVKVTSACAAPLADRMVKLPFKVSVCPDFRDNETPVATKILVTAGTTTTLSVGVDRGDVIEWYKIVGGGAPAKFAEGGPALSTVTTEPITQTTTFFARARSGNCSRDSRQITINVCTSPTVRWSSGNPQQVAKNAPVMLRAGLNPGETADWKWYRGGTRGDVASSMLVYQSSGTYQIPALEQTASFWIRATESGTGCYSDSSVHTVSVCIPTISGEPQSVMINAGASTTLTVATNDLPGVTYQWYTGQRGDITHPVANEKAVSLKVTPAETTSYWVRVSGCPSPLAPVSSDSLAATVTVCKPPAITTQPFDLLSSPAGSVTLEVIATGTTLGFQWYRGAAGDFSAPIENATGSTLSVSKLAVTTDYWVRITGACGGVSSRTARVSIPPSITTQPASNTGITKGTKATLTVAANGTHLSYKWFQRAAGAETEVGSEPSFTTPVLTQDATYFCRVFSGAASTATSDAVVRICQPRTIRIASSTQRSGADVTLAINDATTGETYEWYSRVTPGGASTLAGTGSSIVVKPQQTAYYWARTRRTGCDADSAELTVPVCYPALTSQPQDVPVMPGATTTLSVTANGTPALTYQWYTGIAGNTSAPISNATQSQYLVPANTPTNSYWVRVSSPMTGCSASSTDSNAATVTLCAVPAVTYHQPDVKLTGPGTTRLTVGASGTEPKYQWYIGTINDFSSPINGAKDASVDVTLSVSTTYWVTITGRCGSAVSSDISVSVPPSISQHPSGGWVTKGTTPTLTVAASGTNVKYQWYQRTGTTVSAIFDATGYSHKTAPVMVDSTYFCRTTSGTADNDSNDALLRVCQPREIYVVGYASQRSGADVTLAIKDAMQGETYEWYSRATSGGPSTFLSRGSSSIPVRPLETTYYWARTKRTDLNCDADSAELKVTICYPNIATQPQNAGMNQGESRTLTVGATGTGALAYQWYAGAAGDTSVSVGGNSPSLPVSPSVTTSYWVRVSSPASGCSPNSTDSAAATVSVCPAPVIQTHPESRSYAKNSYSSVSVVAAGQNLHYQWYAGDAGDTSHPIGSDSDTYPFTIGSTFKIWVRVSSDCGSTNSAVATLSVYPQITTQPVNPFTTCGNTKTLSVAANGAEAYTWYRRLADGTVSGIGTGPSLSVTITALPVTFWVDIRNGAAITTSNQIHVDTYKPNPVIRSFGHSIYSPPSMTLEVAVDPAVPNQGLLKYKWYEGPLGYTSWYRTETGNPYYAVNPSYRPVSYWVRVYYTGTGCYADAAQTIN